MHHSSIVVDCRMLCMLSSYTNCLEGSLSISSAWRHTAMCCPMSMVPPARWKRIYRDLNRWRRDHVMLYSFWSQLTNCTTVTLRDHHGDEYRSSRRQWTMVRCVWSDHIVSKVPVHRAWNALVNLLHTSCSIRCWWKRSAPELTCLLVHRVMYVSV